MSDSYGRCLSRKQIYEQAGYPIAVSSSFGFDYLDSDNEKDVQAVIKISKNNE